MEKISKIVLAICLMFLLSACTKGYVKTEKELKQPINCATAKGDIRALEAEKTHVAEEIENGVLMIHPASLVIGLVTGTEDERFRVATGEYNDMIDKKIAEIKRECGL